MKKKLNLLTAILICGCTTAWSQFPPSNQLHNWYVGPYMIDMVVTAPVPTSMPNSTATVPVSPAIASSIANGMYDIDGQLLFYVANNGIYDRNNSLMAYINPSGVGSEIAIVPFGDNDDAACKNKYNVFTTAGGVNTTNEILLVQTIVDMESYGVSTGDLISLSVPSQQEFGAIAVSRNVQANGDRYLYFLAGPGTVGVGGGRIDKVVIHNNGTITGAASALYPSATYPNPNSGGEVFTRELDLSADGDWLAWASYAMIHDPTPPFPPDQFRYHFLHLDPATGDLAPPIAGQVYWQFNLVTGGTTDNYAHSGFRGVELLKDASGVTQLFFGAGTDGIWVTDIPNMSTFSQVSGSSQTYGFSQIELANNGLMYVSSPYATNNIGAFDPTPPYNMATGNSFTLGTSAQDPPVGTWGSYPFFTLPDQIDGQDYGAIISTPIPSIPTTGEYDFDTGTATWDGNTGANPWGITNITYPYSMQVTNKLIISDYSHLTIKDMTFKFSPQAMVVIEPGSSLTLDGTTFTSNYAGQLCNNTPQTWVGVEVWGDKTQSQIPVTAQGRLTLMNSSKIEYAQWGARTWNSFSHIPTGGIIRASNSSFFNNKVGVEFNPYHNLFLTPGGTWLLLDNQSSFYNCTFNADGTYPFTTEPTHVKMNECEGIVFTTCTLKVASTAFLNGLQSIGIRAFDSRFRVKDDSEFKNLWNGINAAGVSGNQPFYVYNSIFEDNATGIAAYKINHFVVQKCTLKIGGNLYPTAYSQAGMLVHSCSGYTIEENDFVPSNSIVSVTHGIFTINSGPKDNQIYKNNFTGLNYGNVASGNNRDNSFSGLSGFAISL